MIKKSVLGRCIKNIREVIPWEEIVSVRLKLDNEFYFHEAEMELSSGERFRIPIGIYKQMNSVSHFQKQGSDYVRNIPGDETEPVIRWNRFKLIIFSLPFWSPLLFSNISKLMVGLVVLGFIFCFLFFVFYTIFFERGEESKEKTNPKLK